MPLYLRRFEPVHMLQQLEYARGSLDRNSHGAVDLFKMTSKQPIFYDCRIFRNYRSPSSFECSALYMFESVNQSNDRIENRS